MADRFLIVNADDFGYSRGVNCGIIAAHERGIVTSTSMMVRWPGAQEAAEYARTNSTLAVGLHLDFGEWVYRGGQWLTRYLVVPLDEKFNRVGDELRRQLDAFISLVGRVPTHIDSHQHFHRREPLRSIVLGVAMELGVPVREFTKGVKFCGYFYGQDSRGNTFPELIESEALQAVLREVQVGITEVCCHPAAVIDFESPYASERLSELEALCDPVVRQTVVAEKLHLTSFQALTANQRQLVSPGQ